MKASYIFTALIAIVAALSLQLYTNSIIVGSLVGFIIFMMGEL